MEDVLIGEIVKDNEEAIKYASEIIGNIGNIGKENVKIETYRLYDLVNSALALSKGYYLEKISIENSVNPEHRIKIKKNSFLQIILILVTNSVHALIDHQNGKIVIKSKYDDKKKNLDLIFSDNGPGVPEKFKKKIFDRYFTTKMKNKAPVSVCIF